MCPINTDVSARALTERKGLNMTGVLYASDRSGAADTAGGGRATGIRWHPRLLIVAVLAACWLLGTVATGPALASFGYLGQVGTPGSGNGQLHQPYGVAVDSSGDVYVTDAYNYRVEKFDSAGAYVSQFGTPGTGPGQFSDPLGVAVDSRGSV